MQSVFYYLLIYILCCFTFWHLLTCCLAEVSPPQIVDQFFNALASKNRSVDLHQLNKPFFFNKSFLFQFINWINMIFYLIINDYYNVFYVLFSFSLIFVLKKKFTDQMEKCDFLKCYKKKKKKKHLRNDNNDFE